MYIALSVHYAEATQEKSNGWGITNFGRLTRNTADTSRFAPHEPTAGGLRDSRDLQAPPHPGVEVSEGRGEVVVHLAGRPSIKFFGARVAHLAHASCQEPEQRRLFRDAGKEGSQRCMAFPMYAWKESIGTHQTMRSQ